jgi:hypothetical protein
MKYLLLHCVDESRDRSQDAPDHAEIVQRTLTSWIKEMEGRGLLLHGDHLRPVSDATTVRVRGEQVLVADGPFAETKEQIGGYDVIECPDLDEAIEVASKHPTAAFGTIEVRPFWME